MTSIQHTLAQAARRDFLDRALHGAGWGLLAGLTLAIAVLAAERLLPGVRVPSAAYVAFIAAGFVGGLIRTIWTGPDRLTVAVRLDRSLGLKDRIGTAVALAPSLRGTSLHDEEFAGLVDAQAQRLAGAIDVARATPVRLTPIWGAVAALAAAFMAGALFLPDAVSAVQPEGAGSGPEQQAAVEKARAVAQSIEQAIAELPTDHEALDSTTQADIEALEKLSEQLASQSATPQEVQAARDESAARLSEASDRLAERAQRDLAAAQEVARRFEGMDALDAPDAPMSAREFADALKRGEFGEAASQLEHLLDDTADLPAEERLATAEHLRSIAEALEASSEAPSTEAAERREQLKQALRDQGLDDATIEDLMNDPSDSTDALDEKLRDQNIDETIARQLADDLEELRQQQELDEQADNNARDVGDALQRAADELENPSEDSNPPQTRPQAQPQTRPQTQPESESEPGADQALDRSSDQEPSSQQHGDRSDSAQQAAAEESREQAAQQGSQEQRTRSEPGESAESADSRSDQPQTAPAGQASSSSESQTRPTEHQSQAEPAESTRSQKPSSQSTQPQRDSASQDSTARQPVDGQQQQQQPGENERADQSQTQRAVEQGAQSRPAQPGDASRRPDEQSPKAPDQASDQSSNQSPDQPQSQPADQSQNAPQTQPQSQAPSNAIRQLAEQIRKAADQRQSAERLKEFARELMENTTPQERQRWAEQWRQQNQQPNEQDSNRDHLSPEDIKQLQDLAREMAENMTPEERRQLAEQMRDQQQPQPDQNSGDQPRSEGSPDQPDDASTARTGEPSGQPGGGPRGGRRAGDQSPSSSADSPNPKPEFESEDVDLRGRESADRVIAQWLTDTQPKPGQEAQPAEGVARARQAQQVAERAVNDSAVHRRYHKMIKRYFGRLDQTIRNAGDATAAPATQPGQ